MGYANGMIPSSELVALSTVGRLPVDAAASYERMRKAALRDGVDLRPTSSADAHRTRAEQERLFFQRYVPRNTGTGDRRIYNGRTYWRLPNVASAAVPGTSNHGNEDPAALDLTGLGGLTGKGYRWLDEHGSTYGWVNPEWAKHPRGGATRELWHWEYSRSRDLLLHNGGASVVRPTPPTSEEDDMTPDQAAQLSRILDLLTVPGQPYGYPEAVLNAVRATEDRVKGVRSTLDVPGQPFSYPAATHNAVGELVGHVAALRSVVAALAAGAGADPAAILEAAREGAEQALAGITITVSTPE